MTTIKKPIWVASLIGLAVFGLAVSDAHAQFFQRPATRTLGVYAPGINPTMPFYNAANPFTYAAPGVSSQQALFNYVQQGRAVASLPPWIYGYNPYPQPIVATGPVFSTPYSTPYSAGGYGGNPYAYSPAAYNPYTAGTGAANPYGVGGPGVDMSNPYAASTYGSGYGAGANPYGGGYSDPYSGYLYGIATGLRAQGAFYKDMEAARLMREAALQAQLDTKKKRFDLETYIRNNTPTYTEVQAKNAQQTLDRIQAHALPGEIQSGQSLNVLLKDIGKHQNRKVSLASIPLEDELLKHLNVTTPNGGNLGLLRDEGRFTWPTALLDLGTPQELRDVETLAQRLAKQAVDGNPVQANFLKDLESTLDKMRDSLTRKVNEIRTPQYLEAKRFLNDFDAAVVALGTNTAPQINGFYRFVRGGKSAQEVADYMLQHGLLFAAATNGDEGAYQALHTALANWDIQLHAGTATAQR
jgi:hypothetical protein